MEVPEPDSERRARAWERLVETGIALNAGLTPEQILKQCVTAGHSVLGAQTVAAGILTADGAYIDLFYFAGSTNMLPSEIQRLPVETPIIAAILREEKPLCLRDVSPEVLGIPDISYPIAHLLCAQLRFGEHRHGILLVFGNSAFSEVTVRGAALLAEQTGIALENAVLFKTMSEDRERVRQEERCAAVAKLASVVGHELRNPLAIINNAAYFLNIKVAHDDERVARNLEIIRKEIQVATGIMMQLLEFSRVRPPAPVALHARALVQDAVAHLTVPENVTVENHIAEDLLLHADPMQMQQALMKLAENALLALEEGGTLSWEGEEREGRIFLRVRDTGIGIPPENLAHIFQPLFSTRRGSIGLGLALVQRVANAHQGNIRVESEAGKGTCFTLELPK